MSIAILLGAGASLDSGMPGTKDITDFILNPDNKMCRHSSVSYYVRKTPEYEEEPFLDTDYVPKIKVLLRLLKERIEKETKKEANYEEIYYAVDQIASDNDGDFDNPILRTFIRQMKVEISSDLEKGLLEIPYTNAWTGEEQVLTLGLKEFSEAIKETRTYMKNSVALLLLKGTTSPKLEPYQWIVDALKDHPSLPIFTLNHDTLVENVFHKNNIKYVDGFEPRAIIGKWMPEIFDQYPNLPHLVKLHGSINWHYETIIQENSARSMVRIYDTSQVDQKLRSTRLIEKCIFLSGTHNKLAAYTTPLYEDLRYQFYQSLKTTTKLIVCGYSFGDKGINTSIINWVEQSNERILVVIHPNPTQLFKSSRQAISQKIDVWKSRNQLLRIEKTMKEIVWSDLRELLPNA